MSKKSIEEMEADVRSAFDWPRLIEELDHLREMKLRFREKSDPADLPGLNGRLVFGAACHVLRALIEQDELQSAYDKTLPDSASHEDKLRQITHRLMLISQIFEGVEFAQKYDDQGRPRALADTTLSALWQEVSAICAGDQPRALAPLVSTQGRPINAYRLAFEQLQALTWEKELRANGWSVANAQNAVASAYGETWTTIYGWRRQVARELGDDLMKRHLAHAEQAWTSRTKFLHGDTLLQSLEDSGRRYRDELSRRVALVSDKKR